MPARISLEPELQVTVHLWLVLDQNGLQHSLSHSAVPRVGVPVPDVLQAQLQLVFTDTTDQLGQNVVSLGGAHLTCLVHHSQQPARLLQLKGQLCCCCVILVLQILL